jgi:acetolactate synthase-1/2/3 large subunit
MKASDWVVEYLARRGVQFVFEVAGGMIAHLLDSLSRQSLVQVVSMHHEQSAAFAAEGVARMTGIPGVAMATSGPGATNLLTGVGSMYFDSCPAVLITGQVNRNELKGQRAIRQLGFQELDIVSMARPVTKAAWAVDSGEALLENLEDAFTIAMSGRPGPVLLDIPMDVQRQDIAPPGPAVHLNAAPPIDPAVVLALVDGLSRAKRPLVLAGGGIRSARVVEPFRELVRSLGVPVVHSLQAVDVLEWDNPLRVGMIGSYGNRWANYALGCSDYLLVLGSRLDVRQTGSEVAAFKGDKTIVHVDCDPGEINNRIPGCEAVVADLRSLVPMLRDELSPRPVLDCAPWRALINRRRADWPDTSELADAPGINPNEFVHALSRASKEASAWVVDVGQHQMWAAQSVELGPDQRFLTSGGMGAMGFALPAAIGAALVTSPKPVVCLSGDGGFQMNIQELETVSRLRLPLKLVVLDNGTLGMVRQFQAENFENRFQSTQWGYGAPDFCALATAYGIDNIDVTCEAQIDDAIAQLWKDPAMPALLRVKIDATANAYPKMTFGKPITEMHPLRVIPQDRK